MNDTLSSSPAADSSAEPTPNPVSLDGAEALSELDDVEFLLEEIENKIAPLALAW